MPKRRRQVERQLPEVRGFRALCCDGQYIYFKLHREVGDDAKNVVFVANVPISWPDEALRLVFEQFGSVSSIDLGVTRRCRFARVEFRSAEGAARAIKASVQDEATVSEEVQAAKAAASSGEPNTVDRWLGEYQRERPDHAQLQSALDAYLGAFGDREAEELRRREEAESTMDADGFTVVSYKKSSKRPGQDSSGDQKKPRRAKELKNFYRFQVREAKREKLARLRERFAQDKSRVEKLKAARKFRL